MARQKAYERETVTLNMLAVFIAKGYESTSMADLMRATGLNKKSLYNEFGSKESLFITVLEFFIDQEKQHVGPCLRQQPYGIDNIKHFFTYLMRNFAETGCLMTISLNEARCIPEAALTSINQTLLAIEQGFKVNLAVYAITDEQVEFFARNLLAVMQGYTSLTRSDCFRRDNKQSIEQFLIWLEQTLLVTTETEQ